MALLLAGCGGGDEPPTTPSGWASELGLCDDSEPVDGEFPSVQCGDAILTVASASDLDGLTRALDRDYGDWCYVQTEDWLLVSSTYGGMREQIDVPIATWAARYDAARVDDDC